MSIKLKTKNVLFRILNRLPDRMGDSIYHKVQEVTSQRHIETIVERAMPSYFELEKIGKQIGIDIKNKTVVEIGSGWVPVMPYCLKFMGGANIIRTYDLNNHFKKERNIKCKAIFERKLNRTIDVSGNYSLPTGIEYLPFKDIINTKLGCPDIIFSRFVMEHVSPTDLRKMHVKFKRELKPGSSVIHFISPSDHRAYVDKNLSLQDFLKYSQEEWDKKQTRFDYHNRWRLPQYIRLFEELGYEIVYLDHDLPKKNSMSYKKFTGLKIHEDFKEFTEEELTAGSIEIVLKV
jgi:hypothetical protein